MEGVSIVPTELLNKLFNKLEDIHQRVTQIDQERKEASATYLTTAQLMKYMNKSRNWIMTHKHQLGCSKSAGTLLFKRADVDAFIESDYFKKK